MIARLRKVDAAGPDEIDNPVFLGKTARPIKDILRLDHVIRVY